MNTEDKLKIIAAIAHHGGHIGLDDIYESMNEIRRLTIGDVDKNELSKIKRIHKGQ